MYTRVLAENLMHYQGSLLLLVINRNGCVKLFYQWTIIVLLFGCLVLLSLHEKSPNYLRRLHV